MFQNKAATSDIAAAKHIHNAHKQTAVGKGEEEEENKKKIQITMFPTEVEIKIKPAAL